MKLKYEKPMIAVESYELTQMIASCSTKIGFLNSECVKKDPDATNQMKDLAWSGFFLQDPENGCADFPTGMDGFDSICYHTNANAAFNS